MWVVVHDVLGEDHGTNKRLFAIIRFGFTSASPSEYRRACTCYTDSRKTERERGKDNVSIWENGFNSEHFCWSSFLQTKLRFKWRWQKLEGDAIKLLINNNRKWPTSCLLHILQLTHFISKIPVLTTQSSPLPKKHRTPHRIFELQ